MLKKWIHIVNLSLCAVLAFLLLGSATLAMLRPSEIAVVNDLNTVKPPPPKNTFHLSKESYECIGPPCLELKFSPLNAQLPDLRKVLLYYGKNGRPDAKTEKPLLHFSFAGSKALASIEPGKPLYLNYERKNGAGQYIFSPENRETALWITADIRGNEAQIHVTMKSESGDIIIEPNAYANFSLVEKEYIRFGAGPWEIGKWRVDGSLLARQRARWYGLDKFLERHGGAEYSHLAGKHRLDFGEGEETYSVFAGLNDSLIWDNELNRWKELQPGTDTLSHPLMVIKKIDERLMNLELWDVEGRAKISLNLLKSSENWMPQNMQQAFKFLGARTRSQMVFEINNERMMISPKDWLILTEAGWKKLITPEDIDAFVDRKLTGALFIFDGIERKDDKQVLIGTMFNSSRTEMQTLEMPIQQGGGASNAAEKTEEENEAESEEKAYHNIRATKEGLKAPHDDEDEDSID